MKKRTIWISSAAAAGVLVLGGTAIAYATTEGFETDNPATEAQEEAAEQLTGTDLEKATKAALAETGPGEVTDAEREDDADDAPEAYELDIRLESGKSVEVSLDKDFTVLVVEDDDADDADDPDDD